MGTTHYYWDPVTDNMFMETDENGDVIAEYDYEPTYHGELNSMTRDGKSYYYHYDGEGDAVAVTDENENVVEEATYTAFGEVVSKTSSITNPFGYRGALGYYANPETDDVYVRNRMYEPTIGRWLSFDPVGVLDTGNRFLYLHNNPINYSDVLGLADDKDIEMCWAHPKGEEGQAQYLGCGNARFPAIFKPGTIKNAWIVQLIRVKFEVRKCDKTMKVRSVPCPTAFSNAEGPAQTLEYYELFLMKDGKVYQPTFTDKGGTFIKDPPDLKELEPFHDNFEFKGGGKRTYGVNISGGKAYAFLQEGFITLYPLDEFPEPPGGKKHFRPNLVPNAGSLSASCEAPPRFNKSKNPFRFLGVSPWNCCPCGQGPDEPPPGTCADAATEGDTPCMTIGSDATRCS